MRPDSIPSVATPIPPHCAPSSPARLTTTNSICSLIVSSIPTGNLGSSEKEDERFLPPIPRVSAADRASGPKLCASERFLITIFLFPNPLVLILFFYSSTSNYGHKAGVNAHVLIAPSSPVHRLLSANLGIKAGSRTGGWPNGQWRRLTRL